MKLVKIIAGVVTDVNCNGADVEAPDWVQAGDSFAAGQFLINEDRRISAIRTEASARVREIFGTGEEKITQMADAIGRIYADLKAQGLLTVGTIAALDPQMEKLNQAKAIRERAEAMIANPELTWE